MPPLEDIAARTSVFAARRCVRVECTLGGGKDGVVFRTSAASAVKFHGRRESYQSELACYQRLRVRQVVDVRGHHVPQLISSDDELLAIEMTVVERPFLLDFANARLDEAPEFPAEVMENWREEMAERFNDRWPQVRMIFAVLAGQHGIHLLDVHHGNIGFEEAPI